jgi:hypothetical protein
MVLLVLVVTPEQPRSMTFDALPRGLVKKTVPVPHVQSEPGGSSCLVESLLLPMTSWLDFP